MMTKGIIMGGAGVITRGAVIIGGTVINLAGLIRSRRHVLPQSSRALYKSPHAEKKGKC